MTINLPAATEKSPQSAEILTPTISFDIAFNYLMLWEDSHPQSGKITKDAGGYTRYGISQKAYPTMNVQNLSMEEAKEFYRKDYWQSDWETLATQALANKHFQIKVNLGPTGYKELITGINFLCPEGDSRYEFDLLCVAQLTHYIARYGSFEAVPEGLRRRAKG